MRFFIILITLFCIFLLGYYLLKTKNEKIMYHWIESLTTCPKADSSRYPKPNTDALALFNKAAKADSARPKTTPQEEIVKLYQQAANMGYWLAIHNLAMSYYLGDGIEEDGKKALYWFKEIEKLDIPEGYTNMALVYRKGIGVPIDSDKSRGYMIKAAQAGDVDSQFYLAHDLYGQQNQNSKFQGYALKLWQCAAEQGHKQAHFFLAIHYEAVEQFPLAYRYYLLGAKAGDEDCLSSLSDAYEHSPKSQTFNLKQDKVRGQCLFMLSRKVRDNPNLTFPDLDTLCPGTVPQPNEMK